jgi:hypothetical protein
LVLAHELGHNFGLHHANTWQVADGNPASASGYSAGYADGYDVMSSNYSANLTYHFSHWNKNILRWIPDDGVQLATHSATYRVHRFDHVDANLARPRAIKVMRDEQRSFWIGYRRAITGNAASQTGAYILWGYPDSRSGDLLDFTTPGSSWTDAPLRIGTSFTDTASGIRLEPIAQGGTGADEWLDVNITIPSRVQWSAASKVAPRGSRSTVSTTRTSPAR